MDTKKDSAGRITPVAIPSQTAALALLAAGFVALLVLIMLAPTFLGLGLAADQPVPGKNSVARAGDALAAREVAELTVRDESVQPD